MKLKLKEYSKMSNKVAVPADLANIAAALQQSQTSASEGASGDLYAKMTKFGEFVYGADNTEFEPAAKLAVNPTGFQHGFICWDDGSPSGEVMVPATQPLPAESDLPATEGKWSKAVAIQARFQGGEDDGIQILFKTNSVGGRKAYAALLQEVIGRIQSGNTDCVPIIHCANDSYEHTKYGKIFVPVFRVLSWADMEGNAAEAEAPAIEEAPEEAAEEEAPRRRRRKAS